MAGPATVEEYLAACPEDSRVALENLRAIVKAIAPDATDTISYQMPAIRHRGRLLLYYAAFKDHCSLFPMSGQIIAAHKAELQGYSLSKGTIRFRPDNPLPAALVEKIVRARLEEHAARDRR